MKCSAPRAALTDMVTDRARTMFHEMALLVEVIGGCLRLL